MTTTTELLKKLLNPKASSSSRSSAKGELAKSKGSIDAVPALIKALAAKESVVQQAAAETIGLVFTYHPKALAAHGTTALPALTKLVNSSADGAARRETGTALGLIGSPALDTVLALVASKDQDAACAGLSALFTFGSDDQAQASERVIPALETALGSKKSEIRGDAANAARAWKEYAASLVPALTKLRKDKDELVRDNVAEALEEIKEAKPAAASSGSVSDKDVDALIERSTKGNREAIVALQKQGARAVTRILAKSKKDAAALIALGHMGTLAAPHLALFTDAITAKETKNSEYTREKALDGIGHLGAVAEPAVPALVKAADSKDAVVRAASRQALAHLAPSKIPGVTLDKAQVARILKATAKAREEDAPIPLFPTAYLDVVPPAALVDLWAYATEYGFMPSDIELRTDIVPPERAWFDGNTASAEQYRTFARDGRGGLYALWLLPTRKPEEMPVVFLGDEGEGAIISNSMKDFLAILGVGQIDLGQLVAGGMKPADAKDFGKSEGSTIKTYRAWLKNACKLEPPKKLTDLVGAKNVPALSLS